MSPDRTTDRRKLLSLLIGGISTGIGGALAAIFGRFLSGSASTQEAGGAAPVSLGKLSEWPDGGRPVERIVSFANRDGYFRESLPARIFLTRTGGAPAVFSATCTHLGCAVSWDAGSRTFRCPCHGGVYRGDGSVVAGPPPRPLPRLAVEIRDGEVFLHPGELA